MIERQLHNSGSMRAGASIPGGQEIETLFQRYGCGPVRFSGTDDALHERHRTFDQVVDPASAGRRERYEAIARSVRDILAQRSLRTYECSNPKRVYCLSVEFLLGRDRRLRVVEQLGDTLEHITATGDGRLALVLREVIDPVIVHPSGEGGKPPIEVKGRLAALTGRPEPMLHRASGDCW
jgi:hypothetical protein